MLVVALSLAMVVSLTAATLVTLHSDQDRSRVRVKSRHFHR